MYPSSLRSFVASCAFPCSTKEASRPQRFIKAFVDLVRSVASADIHLLYFRSDPSITTFSLGKTRGLGSARRWRPVGNSSVEVFRGGN